MTRSRYTVGDGSIDRARELRRNATPAETKLWSVLRGSALDGHKFRRQQRLGPFYGDFVCQAARLVVEIDGDTHVGNEARDARRTAFLEREGYRVLRFSNVDVMGNVEGVAQVIRSAFDPSPSHPAAPGGPLPLPHGERRA
uniref:endonuclease domain-containing protein n=1 Tax=uncultured Sphingomonas sp. TaxID=158754 RepID=UPI0035CA5FF4